jgi:type II secretory pathway component GspD/PulD (secretin)
VSIAVDQRTNSLVLRGQRLRVMELRRVIAELDRAT